MLDNVPEGMNAVIIGESGGIGLAIAQGLQEAGAVVAITGRNLEKREQAEAGLRSRDARTRAFRVDVTDSRRFQEASLRIEQEFGSVDILVNNQEITGNQPAVEVTNANFSFVIAANLTSIFNARSLFGPTLLARERGAIITINASAHRGTPAVSNADGGALKSCN